MAQILDPLPDNNKHSILCCYVNATSQIQIVRISNVPNWYFERVVFPGQRLVFEALREALLEVHTGMMASAILSDTIPCDRLSLDEEDDDGIGEEVLAVIAQEDGDTVAVPETDYEVTKNVILFEPLLASAT